MYTLRYALAVGAAMLVAAPAADAQLRRSTGANFPDAQTLPTGMCQIWIEGLPANRQPAATDCDTARRTQPRNSRIIYGARRPTNVYGNRDPRSIPGTPQYDPRFDPRSPQYDPRLDPHNRDGRRDDDRFDRKRDKEREKWERKRDKERDKEWKKSHKGNGRGHDDGEDDDADDDGDGDHDRRDHDGRYDNRDGRRGGTDGTYGTRGPSRRGCVDANRDGVCDREQTSSQTFPFPIPQTIPQGTTRRVCVDANRDGRCDDGGPLVRVTKP